MTPGKVLLVANTDWYLYNFRLALARYLQSQGFEVALVAPPGRFSAALRDAGFRCIDWQLSRRSMSPAGELRAAARLERIYRAERPALVHHFTIKPVLYGTYAARRAGVPAVVNAVTGLGYIFLKQGWQGGALRALLLPFYRAALSSRRVRVVFENEHDQAIFQRLRLVRPGASQVIPGVGVNAEHFHPAPEPQDGPPLVVFPARMLFDKGLETLVDAARLLQGRMAARFALVGETDPGNPTSADEQRIRGWEQEGLVEWWGFQSDMRAVFQGCNLVALPSFGEGLPTALIEAAASGRAIVATDVAGCRDVVRHGESGLLVPPKDPPALATAIETLLRDPALRARMGAAGRQIVLEAFTDRRVHADTLRVYQSLLPAGSMPPDASPAA